jgi:hypothetical protein
MAFDSILFSQFGRVKKVVVMFVVLCYRARSVAAEQVAAIPAGVEAALAAAEVSRIPEQLRGYTVTITATSGTITETVAVALTVQ